MGLARLACDFFSASAHLLVVRILGGVESATGTSKGPGADPRPATNQAGEISSGQKGGEHDHPTDHHLGRDPCCYWYHGFGYYPREAEVTIH
jgi:hypothetical protein